MKIPNIFEPTAPHDFIACVGSNGYTDGQTYASGFFEAASVLLGQIKANNGNGYEMDILVYPILYSIRHGIELGIKHLLRTINNLDSINFDLKEIENHDLEKLWKIWLASAPFDRRLLEHLAGLDEIIKQFHLADSTGQVFRYHLDTDNRRTLDDKWSVDLISVDEILKIVQEKFSKLFRLVDVVVEERQLGAFTSKLNREELEQLSMELPDYATWKDNDDLLVVKKRWKGLLGIGSNKFSEAIDFIKGHPEFAGNIGIESNLLFLTKEDLIEIIDLHVEYLVRCGPPRKGFGFVKLSDIKIPDVPMPNYSGLAGRLSANAVGEFCALADIGRLGDYSENFEKHRAHLTPFDSEEERIKSFRHFFVKLNLLPSLASGLRKVGARSLSQLFLDAKAEYERSLGTSQN